MVKKLANLGIPALFAALVLSAPGLAHAGPEDARRRALDYLLESQLPVGGWVSEQHGLTSTGHKLAITAVAAHALVANSTDEETLAAAGRAVGFLRRYEGELREPRLVDGFDYTPWAAAYGLVHLAHLKNRWPAGSTAPDTAGLVKTFSEFAARTQRNCGGWDYRVTGRTGSRLADGSVPFLTAVMLDGLRLQGTEPKVRERALADLEGSLDASGLPGYSHEGDHAEVRAAPWWSPKKAAGRAVQARLVLNRCGRVDDAALRATVERFLEVRSEYAAVRKSPGHAKPHEIAGYYYYHAHYFAMRALSRLLENDPGAEERILSQAGLLVAALLSEQAEDGSWEDAPAGGKPYATALALLMLREYRDVRVRWFPDLSAAYGRARESGRPVVLLFMDDNEASRKMVRLFYDPGLAGSVRSVVLARLDRRANPEVSRRAGVYRGPALVMIDPRIEKPLKHPLKKLIGGQDAKKLVKTIGKGLEAYHREGD